MHYDFDEEDCLTIYKREALGHPLLTAAEEIELGRRIWRQSGWNRRQASARGSWTTPTGCRNGKSGRLAWRGRGELA
jgi:hypothetical protein